jgi:uncharacterized Rmd1/YagE family protein
VPSDATLFAAVAFEENLVLRELLPTFPGARLGARDLSLHTPSGGLVFLYPFGAIVFAGCSPEERDALMAQLHRARPRLTTQVVRESFAVRQEPSAKLGIVDGVLLLDRLTPERGQIVALTVAQSASLEYYERIVESLFERTGSVAQRLEKKGTVPLGVRQLHRFIGEAINTRAEVLTVLTLLDKPDATWDDQAMDRIYNDLRAEFDLVDRFGALEVKLRSVQEGLELVLGVARERRLVLLEVTVVALIALELFFSLSRLIGH